MTACSTPRGPASESGPVAYVPDDPSWTAPQDASNSNGHGSTTEPQPALPTANNSNGAAPTCQKNFAQTPVLPGYPLSVQNLLYNAQSYGNTNASWGYDQQILRARLGNPSAGSPIWEAAKYSKAMFMATQYVSGNFGNYYGQLSWQDYFTGARVAAVLGAMSAVGNDPACVQIIQNYAQSLLPPWALNDVKAFPAMAAAQLAQQGGNVLQTEYNTVTTNRQNLQSQIDSLESRILQSERSDEASWKQLNEDIRKRYVLLKDDLEKVPACRDTVAIDVLMRQTNKAERTQFENMIASCKGKITERLQTLRSEEIDLVDRIHRAEDGSDAEFAGSKLERMKARLKIVQDRTTTYQQTMELLNGEGPTSAKTHLAKLDEILKNRTDIETRKKSVTPDEQQRNALQGRYNQLSPRWLAYGYFGGFNGQ